MAFLSGHGTLNMRSEELRNLVFSGKTAQATLDDSESVCLQNITNHSVNSSQTHHFDCVMIRNGLGLYQSKVYLVKISQNYFVGSVEFKQELGGMSE
ncbi:MAG: hypothetical protein UW41_C0010G0033 [Candidatus Collierbacteria bacterium GW2011_GWC2_44_18]|uniref:Uncharacterized protein n=2 Tax=Microgenomates group TaxID=1794810 RepID=A0A0G1J8A3_9BACT|nr:MAG: hypothetical protein UW16_C0004G0028 [Microgenomates group bacterium GW2011_GWC1_44_10]KKT49194.1 MAG: hypothetical protein UW41_C0010G0033 [Candidatus Collierbacteria bacterium GW2011_GWC2_44_18]KKT67515.1 MAG: hypothetical protein UW60_C0005G0029 [Candidatus Woesebacteria bacterium GW2011_GWA2_44_33]